VFSAWRWTSAGCWVVPGAAAVSSGRPLQTATPGKAEKKKLSTDVFDNFAKIYL